MEAPFTPQPAAGCVKEVQFAKPMPSGVVLTLTDAKCAEQTKMEEVELAAPQTAKDTISKSEARHILVKKLWAKKTYV